MLYSLFHCGYDSLPLCKRKRTNQDCLIGILDSAPHLQYTPLASFAMYHSYPRSQLQLMPIVMYIKIACMPLLVNSILLGIENVLR